MRCGRWMTDALEIPASPDGVTADWLTRVLSRTWPDAEVTDVEVLARHSGTTGRLRLGLTYAAGARRPRVGLRQARALRRGPTPDGGRHRHGPPRGPFLRGTGGRGPAAHPAVPASRPTATSRPTTSWCSRTSRPSGCTFTDRLDHPRRGSGRAGDRSPGPPPRPVLGRSPLRRRAQLGAAGHARRLRRQAGRPGPDHVRRRVPARVRRAVPPLLRSTTSGWPSSSTRASATLIHGDTHAGNQFIDGDQVGLYDWAVISRSPGIRDIAIYLGNSCPTDVRRRHQERLAPRATARCWSTAGVDAPSFDTLWLRYRRSVIYAWVAATTTASMGSKWQPVEVGRRHDPGHRGVRRPRDGGGLPGLRP